MGKRGEYFIYRFGDQKVYSIKFVLEILSFLKILLAYFEDISNLNLISQGFSVNYDAAYRPLKFITFLSCNKFQMVVSV